MGVRLDRGQEGLLQDVRKSVELLKKRADQRVGEVFVVVVVFIPNKR